MSQPEFLRVVIDTLSGDKIDLFFPGSDEDSRRAFARRQSGNVFDIETDIATAEDVILSKLRWDARLGGSSQQRADIVNILRTLADSVDADSVDMEYLHRHVGEHGESLKERLDQVHQ